MDLTTMANLPPRYATKLFTDVYDNAESFYNDWAESGLFTDEIKKSNIEYLFYLLYARYGNSPIANGDVTQFCYKMWSIIFQDGANWQKKLDIQKTLRKLEEADILITESLKSKIDRTSDTNSNQKTNGTSNQKTNAKNIHNHAFNPSAPPAADVDEPLNFINEQNYEHDHNDVDVTAENNVDNVVNAKDNEILESVKSGDRVKAYAQLYEILRDDATSAFIDRFKICFKMVVVPEHPTVYINEMEEEP